MTGVGERIDVARLHGPRDIRLHREPVAPPGPAEALLRVTAVGLCGSDRHWFLEAGVGDARLSRPLVLGHEFAGVIADGDRAGERVVAEPADACGVCELCRTGQPNLCRSIRFAGHGTTDGALRTSMPWPSRLLRPLPDRVSDDEGALLEPLGVALHAVDLGQPAPGGSAAVTGCGPIGLMLVAVLRGMGVVRVVASDPLPHRRAAAAGMGATDIVDGAIEGEVDVAFEASGEDAALDDAMTAVRPGGRVVVVGIPSGDRHSFRASLARRKGLTIVLCRRMLPRDLEHAIGLVADGGIDLGPITSHRFPIARVSEAFDTLVSRRGLKVIVNPMAAAS